MKTLSLPLACATILGLASAGTSLADGESGMVGGASPKGSESKSGVEEEVVPPKRSTIKAVAPAEKRSAGGGTGVKAKVSAGGVGEGESAEAAYFRRLDANGDGRVTFEEYAERRPGRKVGVEVIRSSFEKLDADGNGYCTPMEFVRVRQAGGGSSRASESAKKATAAGKATSAEKSTADGKSATAARSVAAKSKTAEKPTAAEKAEPVRKAAGSKGAAAKSRSEQQGVSMTEKGEE